LLCIEVKIARRTVKIALSHSTPELSPEQLQENEEQLPSYALETMSAPGDRSHVFGLLVNDMEASMWYYDRSGIVSSQSFDLEDDFETFIKFVVAFSFISDRELSLLDKLAVPLSTLNTAQVPRTLEGCQMKVDNKEGTIADTIVTLGSALERRPGLVGRGIVVHNASIVNSPGEVVVKMAWPPATQTAEWEFIQRALDKGFPKTYSVVVYGFARGPKLSEGFRSRFAGMARAHYEDRELRVMVSEKLEMAVELPNNESLYAPNCIRHCKTFRSHTPLMALIF
jgi:hypothetical protein